MPKFANQSEKFQWITTAPIPGLAARLAVPVIVSMLVTSVYNMADTYFVGSLGTSAQGAIAVVIFTFAPQIVFAFQKHDPEVVALGAAALVDITRRELFAARGGAEASAGPGTLHIVKYV